LIGQDIEWANRESHFASIRLIFISVPFFTNNQGNKSGLSIYLLYNFEVKEPMVKESSPYVIGIDGGGTKTVGLIADDSGKVIARSESGPSNYHVVGQKQMACVLKNVVDSLLKEANIPSELCRAFCLGMAGLGRPDDREIISRICYRLGFKKNLLLTHDAKIALVGGALEDFGVIIIAGTGSIVYGINEAGEERRSGGWGNILGDEGSGYDIARRALQAIVRAHDGRDKTTILTAKILNQLKFKQPEQLVRWVHAASKNEIAQLAPLVFESAWEQEGVAEEIIAYAAEELILATRTVLVGLDMASAECNIVLSGGIFEHQPHFVDLIQERLHNIAPKAISGLPKREAAYGAVLLAKAHKNE